MRVQIKSGSGGARYDVTYGAGSLPAAPDAAEIAPSTSSVPVPTGPYAVVRSGTTANVAWKLLRAPASAGADCWRWQAAPPAKIAITDRPDGAYCVLPPGQDADPADQVQFLASTAGTGTYDLLALRLPPAARSLTITRIGGKPEAVKVDGTPFVWVGASSPKVGFVSIVLAGGKSLACAPGWITVPSDYASIDPGQLRQVLASPWVCTDA